MKRATLIQRFAESIATMEGFYKPGSLAKLHNNPGNLRSWGTTPVERGYAKFAKVEDGWTALRSQVEKNVFIRKLTFREFFAGKPGVYSGYAPAADQNRPKEYAQFVQGRVAEGVTIDTVIADLVEE